MLPASGNVGLSAFLFFGRISSRSTKQAPSSSGREQGAGSWAGQFPLAVFVHAFIYFWGQIPATDMRHVCGTSMRLCCQREGREGHTSTGEFNFNLGPKHLRCACQAFSPFSILHSPFAIFHLHLFLRCMRKSFAICTRQTPRQGKTMGKKPRAFEYAICNLQFDLTRPKTVEQRSAAQLSSAQLSSAQSTTTGDSATSPS